MNNPNLRQGVGHWRHQRSVQISNTSSSKPLATAKGSGRLIYDACGDNRPRPLSRKNPPTIMSVGLGDWGQVWPSWGQLGAKLSQLGVLWPFWVPRGLDRSLWDRSWGHLGPKWAPNGSQVGSQIVPRRPLGGVLGLYCPQDGPKSKKDVQKWFLDPSWTPKLGPKSVQNRYKKVSKNDMRFITNLCP